MGILKTIDYIFKARKGINHSDELISELSFGPLEMLFIVSFIILGVLTLGLGFAAFFYLSKVALFFAISFLFILTIDIWIFIKVKKFFSKISKKAVDFSKEKYKEFNSDLSVRDSTQTGRVVDVEYE